MHDQHNKWESQGDWQADVEVKISAFSFHFCYSEFSEKREMARDLDLYFKQESPRKTELHQDHKKITPSTFIHTKGCCKKGGNLYSL